MGTIFDIEVDTGYDAYMAEQCVGEGGHFFVREGDRDADGNYYVTCERCTTVGWEKPDDE